MSDLDNMFGNPLEQVDGLVLRAKELVSKSNPQGFVTQIEATLEVTGQPDSVNGADDD